MPTDEAKLARIETKVEALVDDNLGFRANQTAMLSRIDKLGDEVHEAALAMKEVAGELKSGDGRMRRFEKDIDRLRADVDANTAWRWKTAGISGFIAVVGGWVASHWK